MTITFLGTSSAVPTVERGLSSIAISLGSELILFDAGEGMQRNFIKAGLGFNREMKIFITHLHADHCVGLLGLLQTMSLQGRTKALDIFGQPKLRDFILENMRLINFGLNFELRIHVISEGFTVDGPSYKVSCCNASHSIPALSFCLEEFDRPGLFDIARAKSLGIPEGELYGMLQRGKDIMYQGRPVRSSEVVGSPRKGRKICFSGDTRPTSALAEFFRNCDVLIYEATYGQENVEKAKEYWHSTALEAATIAKQAQAKKLYLTHFSARYERTDDLVKEACKIHPDVQAAEDLMEVPIPYPD